MNISSGSTIISYFLTISESVECYVGNSTLILRNDLAGSSSGFFNKPWTEYQQGFGSPTALYWIGLDRLHEISQGNCQVRFDLQDTDGIWYHAQYSTFSVGDSSTNYRLTIGGYSGNAGDAMDVSNSWPFSTYDVDNDGDEYRNYAEVNSGGFWFNAYSKVYITTSSSDGYFIWIKAATGAASDNINLNVAGVSLLCQ